MAVCLSAGISACQFSEDPASQQLQTAQNRTATADTALPQGLYQAWTPNCYPGADPEACDSTLLGGAGYTFSLLGIKGRRLLLRTYPRIISAHHDTASNEGYDMAWYEGNLVRSGDSIILHLERNWDIARLKIVDRNGKPVTTFTKTMRMEDGYPVIEGHKFKPVAEKTAQKTLSFYGSWQQLKSDN